MEDKNSIDIIEKRQQEITFDKIDKLDNNDIEFFSKNVPLLPERDGNRNDLASILVSSYSIKKNKEIESVACFQIINLMHVFFYEELRKRILSIDLSSLKEDSDWKKIFRAMKMALINPQFKVGDILYEGIAKRIETFISKEENLKIQEDDSIFRFFEIFSFLLTDYESGRVMMKEIKKRKIYYKYKKDDNYNIKNAICELEQNEKEIFDQFRSAVLHWKYFINQASIESVNLLAYTDLDPKNGKIDVYKYNDTFCSICYPGHAFFIRKYNEKYYVSSLTKGDIMSYDDFIQNYESQDMKEMAKKAVGLMEEYKNKKTEIEKLDISNDGALDDEDFDLMKKYEGNSNEIIENENKIFDNKNDIFSIINYKIKNNNENEIKNNNENEIKNNNEKENKIEKKNENLNDNKKNEHDSNKEQTKTTEKEKEIKYQDQNMKEKTKEEMEEKIKENTKKADTNIQKQNKSIDNDKPTTSCNNRCSLFSCCSDCSCFKGN